MMLTRRYACVSSSTDDIPKYKKRRPFRFYKNVMRDLNCFTLIS